MDLIGIKYCGGCNPVINRSELVEEIEKLLSPGYSLVTDGPTNQWQLAILICGCPIACADNPTLRRMAKHWIRVGGSTVDLEIVPQDRMAGMVVQRTQKLKMKEAEGYI